NAAHPGGREGLQVHVDAGGVSRVVQRVRAARPARDVAGDARAVAEDERVRAPAAHEVLAGPEGDGAGDAGAGEVPRVKPGDIPGVGHGRAHEGVVAGPRVDRHGGAGRSAPDVDRVVARAGGERQVFDGVVIQLHAQNRRDLHARVREDVIIAPGPTVVM